MSTHCNMSIDQEEYLTKCDATWLCAIIGNLTYSHCRYWRILECAILADFGLSNIGGLLMYSHCRKYIYFNSCDALVDTVSVNAVIWFEYTTASGSSHGVCRVDMHRRRHGGFWIRSLEAKMVQTRAQ
eukprot:897115_1